MSVLSRFKYGSNGYKNQEHNIVLTKNNATGTAGKFGKKQAC